MLEAIALFIGFALGVLVCKLSKKSMGKLLMYRSDDPGDPPYLLVELYDSPESLYGYEQVTLDISHK